MIVEIQYLRAIAALMVVFYHTVPQLERMGYTGPKMHFLSSGVDIFFVISGFIMTYIVTRTPQTPLAFLWNRMVRILPLYWGLTLFMVVVGILAPSLLQSSIVQGYHLFASLFFIPAYHPVNGEIYPLLTPGWTLNYEMFFYVIFSLCLLLPAAMRNFAAIALISILTVGFRYFASGLLSEFYGNPIVFDFCGGIVLGWAYCAGYFRFADKRKGRLAGALAVAVGFAALVFFGLAVSGGYHLVKVGIPSFLVVLGALAVAANRGACRLAILERIGDASYSLYLSHFIMMSLLGQVARKLIWRGVDAPAWSYPLFSIAAVAICVIVSLSLHDIFEVNTQRFLRGRRSAGKVRA